MVKPASATIGLHQTDVIFVSELVDAIQQFLAISKITNHDQDLKQASTRENSDLGDRPGITLDKTLHLAFGNRCQDVVERIETAHAIEKTLQLSVMGMHH
jgi:hypothetical protein